MGCRNPFPRAPCRQQSSLAAPKPPDADEEWTDSVLQNGMLQGSCNEQAVDYTTCQTRLMPELNHWLASNIWRWREARSLRSASCCCMLPLLPLPPTLPPPLPALPPLLPPPPLSSPLLLSPSRRCSSGGVVGTDCSGSGSRPVTLNFRVRSWRNGQHLAVKMRHGRFYEMLQSVRIEERC